MIPPWPVVSESTRRLRGADGISRAVTTVQTLVLAGCLLLTLTAVGVAIGGPSGQPYTEFAVLAPEDGRLVADDYPSLESDNGTVVVTVANHERVRTTYTVVATAQQVDPDGPRDPVRVRSRTRLGVRELTVDDGDTGTVRFDVTESPRGESVRIVFELYRGDGTVTGSDRPYRSLHLWVTEPPTADSS